MIKKTFSEILQFLNLGGELINLYPKTKLAIAIKKVSQSIDPIIKEYYRELEKIKIRHCYTDERGVVEFLILKDAKGNEKVEYKYTKEGLQKRLEEQEKFNEEFNKKEFEIDNFILDKEDIKGIDLSENDIQILKDFIL